MTDILRIAVTGMVVRFPAGGLTWHYLHYVLGLRDMGHDVRFVETSGDYPSCWDPAMGVMTIDPAYGLEYTKNAFSAVGLADRWMYHDAHQSSWFGGGASTGSGWCSGVDILINVSGVTPLMDWMLDVPLRIFVDTDPGFTQVRHINEPERRSYADAHNAFATFGENIGAEDCGIPDDGLPWVPTRQPIAINNWLSSGPMPKGSFTTVMYWDSYAGVEHDGLRLGMKSDSFADYENLPSMVSEPMAMAVARLPAEDTSRLNEAGWLVEDAGLVGETPWTYRDYIGASKAEFSVAKHGYVTTQSGWFSERSANYLASGRPVITQDTGFSKFLPTGEGLIAYSDADGAAAAVSEVAGRYRQHCQAARDIAVEHFDARRVLGRLLGETVATTRSAAKEEDGR